MLTQPKQPLAPNPGPKSLFAARHRRGGDPASGMLPPKRRVDPGTNPLESVLASLDPNSKSNYEIPLSGLGLRSDG